MTVRKAIILAGRTGTRPHPATLAGPEEIASRAGWTDGTALRGLAEQVS